ncbi:hypothetical protein EJB05_09063 [Eragrostis curvula]|uniref:Response regulatory domain-containing protein n=1 Tax=Eragrostis curvula TaxID=38414 RepID=A0A5J9T5J0_9POAL|nr:hypothetical protein EJB05_49887 [Eragrostis curvula]TVU42644.1 hypothetical protein EJB05_09063 [Eragrostis curvula]
MSTSQLGNASTKASPHVLVVDDANVDRFIASKLLQRSNIRVTAVDGPKQALKVLDEENDVKLILTDYCMPEMTGYDLLMAVKESPKLKHLPVVIMSAESIPSRIKECMDGGAKEYIVKPIRATDIARILSYI